MTNTDPSRERKFWQSFGFWEVVLAVLSIILTLVIFKLQQERKNITYEILSNSSLLSVEKELKGDIEISYKGRKIENAQMIVLRIENLGSLPIPSSDFEGPIEINTDGTVLSAEITKTAPPYMPARVESVTTNSHSSIKLAPVLLNPGNFITLKIMLTNFDGSVNLTSQIIGAEIHEKPSPMVPDIPGRVSILSIILLYVIGMMAGGIILRWMWTTYSTTDAGDLRRSN